MAVRYSGAGNIKITTTHSCKASELMMHGKDIAKIITPNRILSVLPDTEHHRVKINKVPTWCRNDTPMDIAMVHEELWTYVLEYRKMKQWRVPRWLGSEEYIHAKNFTSVVIDLANDKDRNTLLSLKRIQLFNTNCTISPYEERTQVFQCTKCGMFSHHTVSCRQPRCIICTSKEHSMDEHPNENKPNCINCRGDHPSNTKDCNARHNCLGMKPIPVPKNSQNQNKPRAKGTNQATTQTLMSATVDHNNIGLMDEEISSLMNMKKNQQTVKQSTARLIQ